MEARGPSRTVAGASAPASHRLVFLAAGRPYSLPLTAVRGLLEPIPPRRVPLAPDYVLGILERHGAVVTVLHLSRLIDGAEAAGKPALVRLAPPWDHLALRVDEPVRVVDGAAADDARPLDPAALVALASSAMASCTG